MNRQSKSVFLQCSSTYMLHSSSNAWRQYFATSEYVCILIQFSVGKTDIALIAAEVKWIARIGKQTRKIGAITRI